MDVTDRPGTPEIWPATPCAAQALIVSERDRFRDLEGRLGQASNSSRPPSSDLPWAPGRAKAAPSGRRRGATPSARGLPGAAAWLSRWTRPRRGAGGVPTL
jgi:hypothetical protein